MLSKDVIEEWVTPYAEALGLPYFPRHVVTIFRSMMLWWSIQLLSHGVSPYLFPKAFANMPARKRTSWDVHIVSLVHSSIVAPLLLYYWLKIDENTDRLYGYRFQVGQLYSLSFGYFVWDVIVSLRYEGLDFIIHGLLGLSGNIFVFKPLLMFGGMGIIMWELSTPFLNIHWLLDKLGLTGSLLQFVNAMCLLLSYVTVRMIIGVSESYKIVTLLWSPAADTLALPYKLYYSLGLLILNALNYIWFFKMLHAMRKRFLPAKKE